MFWPTVAARLVELLPTLPGYTQVGVYDGEPVTADAPTAWVTVGFAEGKDSAGDFELVASTTGYLREESGTVLCEFVAVNGDDDPAAARTHVFALVDSLSDAIRADQRLGVLPAGSTASLTTDVAPARTDAGAIQRVTVTVSYFARS